MDLKKMINEKGLLFDGAMGTMLIQAGIVCGKASEYWNLEKPDVIRDIHESYIQAGSTVITTNTFGGTRLKLKKAKLDRQTEEINTQAVHIARSASGEKLVAGDIGPTGEMLLPMGEKSPQELRSVFREQAGFLDEAGVDLFIIETMFDIQESLAAIRAVRDITDKPLFATLTFEYKNGRFATMMGNPAIDSLKQLQDNGADAVGANCSVGSDTMVLLAKKLAEEVDGWKIIQPNAGMPKTEGSQLIYPEDEDYFSANIQKIRSFGVQIVGGCCGTTPEYIKAIRAKLG